MRVIIATLVLLAACDVAREPIGVTTGAVAPGSCDPFDDNIGATPATAVDLLYDASGSGCGIPNGGFRFHAINLDTAWDYFCPLDSGTAGSSSWVWLCANDALTVTSTTCAHNAGYTSTYASPGVPGPAWAPCWKQNTTSKFRRLMPGQSGSGFTASTGGGQMSILVTNGPLPDPPLCPYRAGVPGAVVPTTWQNCGTTSDSGRAEWILSNAVGAKVTGLWPSGQTGAPCRALNAAGTADIVATYNCPVEPRSHYDY